MTHTQQGVKPVLQVLRWRRVCVLYTMSVCVLLPEFTHSAKSRCGVELIADLQLVCGDRGFYRGHGAMRSASSRRRDKGIVEQCCIKGCDLQHLEQYCADPKRERRHTPHTEDQFWRVFHRRYEMNQFENEPEKFVERVRGRLLYQRKFRRAASRKIHFIE